MALRPSLSCKEALLRRWTVLALTATSTLALQAPAFAQATDPHAGHVMGGMVMAGMTPPSEH
jgi:hypothetical protein